MRTTLLGHPAAPHCCPLLPCFLPTCLVSSPNYPSTNTPPPRLPAVQAHGFWGILLLAAYPNAAFDLCGICCGHFLMPFWEFFGATLIGKGGIKVSGRGRQRGVGLRGECSNQAFWGAPCMHALPFPPALTTYPLALPAHLPALPALPCADCGSDRLFRGPLPPGHPRAPVCCAGAGGAPGAAPAAPQRAHPRAGGRRAWRAAGWMKLLHWWRALLWRRSTPGVVVMEVGGGNSCRLRARPSVHLPLCRLPTSW